MSSSSTYDRFGPYKDEELPYCGVVLTAPLRQDENVMHVVFVDREQPLFCMPASLFKETVTHHRDLAKFRRDWLLDFGDGVQFDAEYTDEFPFPIVTKYRKTHKPYETINEDTKNLLKTIGLFSVDLKTCWTRLFGIIPIEESQTNAGVPNVVYECWVRIWLVVNYDRGVLEKLNVKTTLHKLIKVSEDERSAIWEAPWNKDHPKFPHISPFEDEEDEMALIEAHLERPLERQLDIFPKQEGIYLGQGKKEVFAPKFSNYRVFIGLERDDCKLTPGKRIEMDMFWNDVLHSYVVYYYDVIKRLQPIEAEETPRGVVKLKVELNLRSHTNGFYEHPIFGLIVDDVELLGILPTCSYAHKIQHIAVYITDVYFGRFARFAVDSLHEETKALLRKAVKKENDQNEEERRESLCYQRKIDEHGIVINANGEVYCLKYPYPIFEFILDSKIRHNFNVGQKIWFKSNWNERTARQFIIYRAKVTEADSSFEALAVFPYGKACAARRQARSDPLPNSFFKLYVNSCERHSTLFEAGPFGLIEDPDLVMGPIKGVKPTGNRVNKICGFWVICAEDLGAAKLTYLKIIDSIDQKTSLQGYLKRNFSQVEGFRMGYANINDVNGMREQGSDHRHIERNAEMLENVHINDGSNYPAQGNYYESYNQEEAYQLKTNNNRVQLQAYQQPVFSTFALEDDDHDQQPTMPFSTGQQFQQGYRSLKTGQIYLPSTFSQSSTPNLP